MITKVSLHHEPGRNLPWIVRWFGDCDRVTRKQRRYSKAFRHSREAKVFQCDKQAELNHGGPRDRPDDVTLGRLLDEFEEARVRRLSPGSQSGYKNSLGQLREHFGNHRPIRQINQRQAEVFMANRKRRDGRPGDLSSHAKLQHLIYCRAAFNAAIAWCYLDRNPFAPPQGKGQTSLRIKAKSAPWHHLTPDEFASLLPVVPSVRRRAAYWIMYGCGLRPGEVYNLTIDCIDLETRRLHVVNRASTAEVPPFTIKAEGDTAVSKERSVPIPEAAIPDITAACQASFKSGGFVVLTPERFATVQTNWRLCRVGKPWAGHSEHRSWLNRDMLNNLLRDTKLYLRKAGMELSAPFKLTTFRKSFGQNHANAGTPPRTLAKLMGHADVSVTMEFYNRVTDANEREAARTMNRLLGSKGADRKVSNAG